MKLMRLGRRARGGQWCSSVRTPSTCRRRCNIDGPFLAHGGVHRLPATLAGGALGHIDPSDQRVGAPVARRGAVICLSQNHGRHAKEPGTAPPKETIVLLKHPMTIVCRHDDAPIRSALIRTDREVERAVAIGRTGSYLGSPDEAMSHVAGYAVANNVSKRHFHLTVAGDQWSKFQCCATFNSLEPALVPADEVVDIQHLRMRTWDNRELRQDSTTADVILSVPYLVWHLSQDMPLHADAVINTGTLEGVALSGRFGYMRPGDVVELEIGRLGRQHQVLRSAEVSSREPPR